MTDTDVDTIPNWYREIFPNGKRTGFYEALEMHSLVFVKRSEETLIVTFDNLAEAGGRQLKREPWAGKFVADNGWSHLSVFSKGPTWFREAALIDRLEALRDQGFFDTFDKVVFAGTSMGGFGALTFARLAPGATVMSFSPQSTLHPDLAPWETRFAKGRVQDWSLPYSDAADGLATAGQVFVVYDPFEIPDKQHADRLPADRTIHLRAPGCGHRTALVLRRMDRLKPAMSAAIDGSLDQLLFAQLVRNRRRLYIYKEAMVHHLTHRGHPERAEVFTRAFRRLRRREAAA